MDIEHLTKSQLVMLTLLISFVTSMASGIVSVALMQQAPPSVAQIINHVVEHTVEKIVKVNEPRSASAAASGSNNTDTLTSTMAVGRRDIVARIVSQEAAAIVHLYDHNPQNPTLLGVGVLIPPATLMADESLLASLGDVDGKLADGTVVRFFVNKRDLQTGIAYMTASSSDISVLSSRVATVASSSPALGADVVGISGVATTHVQSGIIGSFAGDSVPIIETNFSGAGFALGAFLFTFDGDLAGISTAVSRTDSSNAFVAVSSK